MIPTGLHGWNLTLRHLSTNKNTFMKNNKSVFTGFVFSLLFFVINGNNAVFAQLNDTKPDTLKITLEKVEAEFLNSNLQLLASRFNISASEAEVVQAKLWNNPNISIEQNIYNQYTKKLLDFTSSGNTGIQIQQLITLAGKRNKQIKIASINKEISEYNFAEILRSLKYELRTDFYDLYFLQQSVIFYDESIPPLKKAIELIQGAYSSRSILLSEILRLKSLLLSLETDRLEIVNHISALENDLRILQAGTTQKGNYYVPEVDTASINKLSLNQLWWNLSVEDTALELNVDVVKGLSNTEVQKRLIAYGFNQLPVPSPPSFLALFLHQFSSLIVWILIFAAVISGFLREMVDSLAIVVIIFLNAVIGFVQELKAVSSIAALKKLSHPTCKVMREGILQTVSTGELVPGDLVILEAGDLIPADGRIVYSVLLSTDEASLTGESVSTHKITASLSKKNIPIGDRKNMAFMGTSVASGKGSFLVTETVL